MPPVVIAAGIGAAATIGGKIMDKRKGQSSGTGAPSGGGGGGPDWLPSAIGAGGQLLGSYIQGRSANKATDAASKANAATLAYTRQKDAQTRADALRREGLWQNQFNDWNKARNAALQRYGFNFQFSPISGYGPQTPMGSPGMAQAVPRAALGRPRPSPYADEAQPPGDAYANSAWNDWRRYGLE